MEAVGDGPFAKLAAGEKLIGRGRVLFRRDAVDGRRHGLSGTLLRTQDRSTSPAGDA